MVNAFRILEVFAGKPYPGLVGPNRIAGDKANRGQIDKGRILAEGRKIKILPAARKDTLQSVWVVRVPIQTVRGSEPPQGNTPPTLRSIIQILQSRLAKHHPPAQPGIVDDRAGLE